MLRPWLLRFRITAQEQILRPLVSTAHGQVSADIWELTEDKLEGPLRNSRWECRRLIRDQIKEGMEC